MFQRPCFSIHVSVSVFEGLSPKRPSVAEFVNLNYYGILDKTSGKFEIHRKITDLKTRSAGGMLGFEIHIERAQHLYTLVRSRFMQ